MITGVILARNEAANIVDCIHSISPYVEDLILIDMESEDDTVALARPLVTSVLSHPKVANFDAARNVAIPESKNDWIWFVDADERVPARLGARVRDIIVREGKRFEAIVLPFKTYFSGKWIEHCGWWPGYTMPRVLKRGYFRFNEAIHSGVSVDGRQIFLPPDPDVSVEHFSYQSIEHYVEKFNRYTSTEADNLRQQGASFDWSEGIRAMTRDLWWYYERHEGHRDGAHGWILSWLAGQYRWFSHAKLLDSPESLQNGQSIPVNLDDVLNTIEGELSRCRKDFPVLPLGIVWRSPIWDVSGYACESRSALRALAQLDRAVVVEETSWGPKFLGMPPEERALISALERVRRPSASISVVASIPTFVRPDPNAAVNVLRTTFETDRIPAAWLPNLEPFDEIWVWSRANERAFRRGGVAPEKIRVIPGCVDVTRYRPSGRRLALPDALKGRFVFLSVFDWQLRKGWDALLRAYSEEFDGEERVGLFLKVTLQHVADMKTARQQADRVLGACGTSLDSRPDIVISDVVFSEQEMAALYRSVDAFVLPARAEGWGRPYLEAMASGLPTIGTAASGNGDFMNDSNSFVVAAHPTDVSDDAAREIPIFGGHRWHEPEQSSLQKAMRRVWSDRTESSSIARRAVKDVRKSFGIDALAQRLDVAIESIEERFRLPARPNVEGEAIRIELEGEILAGHSFSKINEVFCARLLGDPSFNLQVRRVTRNPTRPAKSGVERKIESLASPGNEAETDVVIRHAYPPNWQKPNAKKWVHIQPWEYGYLPIAWAQPLRELVDEIWVPSEYVRSVYERSGVPSEKIQLVPWGIDPNVYSPDVPDLILPTNKSFRFLFVGGAIKRKGFDLLIQAYLKEFGPDEDVCLVVKDMGTKSFYFQQTYQQQVQAAIADPRNPAIVYQDVYLSEGQLASLYVACDCMAAPYRGEGFGLPVLEAMACGLPAIVPRGGPTDDYVTDEMGYLLPSEFVECDHPFRLTGVPDELSVSISDLRSVMRYVFENRSDTAAKGKRASQEVRTRHTWEATIERMKERLRILCDRQATRGNRSRSASRRRSQSVAVAPDRPRLSLCMIVRDNQGTISAALESIRPWVDEMIVVDTGSADDTPNLCRQLGAQVFEFPWCDDFSAARNESIRHATSEWLFWMDSDDVIDEANGRKLRQLVESSPDDVMAYVMQVHCPSRRPEGAFDVTVVDHVKLFRNCADLRFDGRIHEQILPSIRAVDGEVAWSDIFVVHSGSDQTDDGKAKKLDRDLRILEKDLEDRPEHPFVLFNLGMTYADAQQHEVAIDFLLRSIAVSSPEHSHVRKAYALLVSALSAAQKTDEAWEACQNGRRIFPNDPELLFREGMLHHHFGRLAQAASSYLKAMANNEERHFASRDPGIVGIKAQHNLARVYEDMGDREKAVAQWRSILQHSPAYRFGWRALLDLHLRHTDAENAELIAYELDSLAASELPGLRPEVAIIRTRLALYRGLHDEAVATIRQAAADHREDVDVQALAGQVLFEHAHPQECLPVLESLVARNPSDASAHHNLGTLHLRLNRLPEAIQSLETSLRLRPKSPSTSLQLGHALSALGRHVEAAAVWRDALRDAPGNPDLASAIRLATSSIATS